MPADSRRRVTAHLVKWMLGLAAGLVVSAAALPQEYPSRPVRLLVPYPPGGSADLAARLVATKMTESLGQSVVVENKPGASNIVAIREQIKSPKDGYTLLVCTNVALLNVELYRTTPYNLDDLAPISPMIVVPYSFSVSKDIPARTVKEFIEYVKANPGKLNYGTTGPASTPDILSRKLESMWDLKMVGVPYQGSAPAVLALASNEVQLLLDPVITTMPQHKAGKFRSIGVTTKERLASMPDVPTLQEQGYPLSWGSWFAVCGSTGTPDPVLEKVNHAVVAAVKSADFQQRMSALGAVPTPMTRDEFARFMKNEQKEWADMIRPLGIKLD